MSEKKNEVFVIMPFSKTTDEHTEDYWNLQFNFIKSRIEEIPNINVRRSEALRGDILREIIRDLIDCQIVLADLTDLNPNVYWELGVRQSFKHGTITIAETRKRIPFDIGMKSILRYYPKDSLKNEEFVKKLKKAIKDCIENPEEPDSHILETIGGRGTIYQIINKDESIRRITSLISECEFNKESFFKIIEQAKKNIENRGKKGKRKEKDSVYEVELSPLEYACIQLLVVNRYLDESDDFYYEASKCLSKIKAVNALLPHWGNVTIRESIEDWLIEIEKETNEILKKFDKSIKILKTKFI